MLTAPAQVRAPVSPHNDLQKASTWSLLCPPSPHILHTAAKAIFFFFGCTARLVGSQLPDQGLNPGHSSESPESPNEKENETMLPPQLKIL